jgi:hypothetical protein
MKKKILGVIAGVIVTIVVVAAWAWYDIQTKPANPSLQEKVKALVKKYPELQPSYDKCMEDGVLTVREAWSLLNELEKTKKK